MISYDLSKRGKLPIYEYLFQCVARDILEGNLSPGERLPSKRALARHLNIGVITVANTYEMLALEGYRRESPAYHPCLLYGQLPG